MKKMIPPAVVQRLPIYVVLLRERKKNSARRICSDEIARALGLTPSTVRQDFSHLSMNGTGKRGYRISRLERNLTTVLDMNSEKRFVIVGAGNMGRAIAQHTRLREYGFNVRAIVDRDPYLVGQRVGKLRVQNVDRLPEIVRRQSIDIGIIAVPAKSAQNAADRLIVAGVRGLFNLAATRVVSRRSVAIVDARLVNGLMLLSHRMAFRRART